jgi:hypothetical protein
LPFVCENPPQRTRANERRRLCIPEFAAANSIGVPLKNLTVRSFVAQSATRPLTVNSLQKPVSLPREIGFRRQVSNQGRDLSAVLESPGSKSTYQ